MELLMMKTPKKRPLGHSSDGNVVECLKLRKRVQVSRDFPPGCGIKEEAERMVFKDPKDVDSNVGNVKLVGSDQAVKPKELVRNKPCFGSRPTGKVKYLDPKSLKEGHLQKPEVTLRITRRKPLKIAGRVDSNPGKMTLTSQDKVKLVEFEALKHDKPKELGRKTSYLGARRKRKVKSWDPTCSKDGDAQKVKVTFKNFASVRLYHRKEQARCDKIQQAMMMFDEINERLYQENKSKPEGKKIADWRVPQEAAKIVKQKMKLMDPEKVIGPVCGVQIGDKFKYRAQLQMIGLHCHLHSGIDYVKIGGKKLAVSIVDSHRYSNESGSCDKLIYCGHGGLGFMGAKLPPKDQKLERGNLALKNSMVEKNSVRVIRKVQGVGKGEFYVYDGLYIVSRCSQRSEKGKTVFKFQLDRLPEQPQLLTMINGSR